MDLVFIAKQNADPFAEVKYNTFYWVDNDLIVKYDNGKTKVRVVSVNIPTKGSAYSKGTYGVIDWTYDCKKNTSYFETSKSYWLHSKSVVVADFPFDEIEPRKIEKNSVSWKILNYVCYDIKYLSKKNIKF